MRDNRSRLRDMIQAINDIENYAVYGKERFDADDMIRVYVAHNWQIIGEAAYKLSADLRSQYLEVPWPKILGLRHVLVHDYFRVDYEIVWGVVEVGLPPPKSPAQGNAQRFRRAPREVIAARNHSAERRSS
jgi:uncharacterized protein with HEPN domain